MDLLATPAPQRQVHTCQPRELWRFFSQGFSWLILITKNLFHETEQSQTSRRRDRRGEVNHWSRLFLVAYETSQRRTDLGQVIVTVFFCRPHTVCHLTQPRLVCGSWFLLHGSSDSRLPFLESPKFFSLVEDKRGVLNLKQPSSTTS